MEAPEVGTVQRDSQGEWIVIGVSTEPDTTGVSRVRRGSLAHRVLSANDPRLARSLPPQVGPDA